VAAARAPPRTTAGAPLDLLLELVNSLRRELRRRDEVVAGEWVEATAQELRDGRKPGWYLPPREGGGLAFYSARRREAFGHVHVEGGTDDLERAARLAETMLDRVPADLDSIDVGFTGLPAEAEATLSNRLLARPGSRVIERRRMERDLGPEDDRGPAVPPPGLVLVPVRDVTLDALADLDRRAFAGSVDELLIGPDPSDYRRVLETLLDGKLGRFVDEASTALIVPDPPRLVGALLTGEQSPRRAIFLDFMVDPSDRGRGYGRFLFGWGLRALRALGYSSVRLWVTASNGAAIRLYDANGLSVVTTATIYRWDRPGSAHPHAAR
jgi:ribosomal protein S18 acetylase RimI-like enzyme